MRLQRHVHLHAATEQGVHESLGCTKSPFEWLTRLSVQLVHKYCVGVKTLRYRPKVM